MVVTWNPSDTSANITLSNGNLTATKSAANATYSSARATLYGGSAKRYMEYTVGAGIGANGHIGIANPSLSLSNGLGQDANGIGYFKNGAVYYGSFGAPVVTGYPTYTGGDVVSMAVDLQSRLLWFRVNGGNWNNSGTANPATGVGGFAINPTLGWAIFPAVAGYTLGDAYTANFGATAFAYTPPVGFSGWETKSLDVAAIGVTAPQAASATTVAIAAQPVNSGDILVVSIGSQQNVQVSSVTDTAGNVYTRKYQAFPTVINAEIWTAIANGSATPTITVTWPSGVTWRHGFVARIQGQPSVTVDKTNNVTNTTAGLSTGVLAQAVEIIFGHSVASPAGTITASPGWTQFYNPVVASGYATDFSYKLVSSTTSVLYNPGVYNAVSTGQILVSFTFGSFVDFNMPMLGM